MPNTSYDPPPLDRWRFDETFVDQRPVWGLPAIAKVLGVSIDTARRWANDPGSGLPIAKPGGYHYCALHGDLMAWLRGR